MRASALRLMALMLLLVFLASAMNGCGWRLRGSLEGGLALPPLYLDMRSGGNDLRRELERALQSNGVTLVTSPAEAGVALVIEREDKSRRVLSVGSGGKVREYELLYELGFSVNQKGEEVLASQSISLRRDYAFSEEAVLAKSDEQERLFEAMRSSAVQSVLRRLQTLGDKLKAPEAGEAVDRAD